MSFDILFLPAGVPFAEAMEALETAALTDGTARDLPVEWPRIEERVRSLLDRPESFDGPGSREISEEATGITLAAYGDEISLTVPYWHEDESADRVIEVLRAVCSIVEEETGRIAYDPQADAPFLGGGATSASSTLADTKRVVEATGATLGPTPQAKRGWWRRRR